MLFCDQCKLGDGSSLFPIGSPSPTYYILGDAVVRDEVINNQVFTTSTQAHQYLINTMYALDMHMDNCRLFKLVRCDNQYNEDLLNEARPLCSNYAKVDIFKTKPKLIITLGAEATKTLLGDKFRSISSSRGRLYDIEINGESFKLLPTYSPNYVVNNPNASSQFIHDLNQAKSFINGELVDIAKKRLTSAINYAEFKKYYDEELVKSNRPAYDLETNAYDPRSEMAKMVGFSLAPDTNSGIYVVRNSLEYQMPEEDWEKIVEITKEYLMSRTCLVHNIMYEGPFTLNEWGIDILDRFDDTLIKARMLKGGSLGSAGLKDQCIKNLGYPDWDTDLGNYKDAFLSMMSLFKMTPAGKNRWEFDFIRTRGLCALLEEYAQYDESEFYGGVDKNNKPKLTRTGKVNNTLIQLRDTILRYYEDDADYSIIMEIIGEEVCNLIESRYDGPFSYGFIPMKLIRKYGAMDAVGTQDLDIYLEEQIDELSKQLNIDLHKGYHYTKRQFIAGALMELNGLHWNDEVADKEENWCMTKCYDNLLAMINSPFLDNHLLRNNKWIFNNFLFNNKLDYVMEVLGQPIYPQKAGIKLHDGTKYRIEDLCDVLSARLGYDFYEANREFALQLIRQEASSCTDFIQLKRFFNPGSTTQYTKDLVNSVLITNDIKVANLIARMNLLLDEESFDINKYPPNDRKLFQVLIDCREYNKYVEEFNAKLDDDSNDEEIMDEMNDLGDVDGEDYSDDPESDENDGFKSKKIKLTDKETFDKFMQVLQSIQVQSSEVQRMVGEALNYRLDSLSEFAIIDLHKYYVIAGVVLDDLSTWTDRFKFLINFRTYKKCYKLRSTYITGRKVGRGQVWMVNEEALATGEELTKRRRKWDGTKQEGETTLMQGTFAVAAAETLRWRAGLHTIPSDASIKNIYDSRYKGGVIFAPDFSQMEVRCMAGVSKCKPMIDAFISGADIHMQNACKIFRKSEDQVTAAERRYAKMATFMILYGGDYRSFGEEFLDGDIALAKYIYESFYEAYPEIEKFINDRHREVKETGKVTTLMNTFINIDAERYGTDNGKILRAAQNYPIQSAGSYMAGNVLYEVFDFLKKRKMLSKPELFIHDSIEIDVHPKEMLQLALKILPLMNKYPMDEFGIPTTADLTIGVSIGQEVECTEIETNDDYTEGSMTCSGMEEDFMLLMNKWKEVYEVVEWEYLSDPKPVYESWSQMFVSKRCINPYYGTTRNKIKARVHIKYGDKISEFYPDYDGKHNIEPSN